MIEVLLGKCVVSGCCDLLRFAVVGRGVGEGMCPGPDRTPPALGVGIHHRGPTLDLAFGDATAPVDKAR